MSDLAMSRRAVTRAIVTLPAFAAVPAIAAEHDPDAAIKAAWDGRFVISALRSLRSMGGVA